jgi:hypothetical protein
LWHGSAQQALACTHQASTCLWHAQLAL